MITTLNRSIALALLLLAADARAQQQTAAQQACINAYNKAAVRVAKARAAAFNACVLEAVAHVRHVDSCYAFDPAGKIAKAEAKLAGIESKRCAPLPDFGHAPLTSATGSASAETIGILRQIHVTLPHGLPVAQVECMQAVNDHAQKLLQAKLKAFLKCKKAGLASGTVMSAATLASCLDSARAAADTKIAKVAASAAKAVAKLCTVPDYLAGCVDETPADVSACLDRIADCRACRFAEGVDAAATDCDAFDDGVLNASCPDACGNGSVGAGLPSWEPETCDDGNTNDGDGCDHNCTPSGCGNGVLSAGESCDELSGRCVGGTLDGQACELDEQCDSGTCASCPPGGCIGCNACGAGTCCDTMFGCILQYGGEEGCTNVGTPVSCDAAVCQHSGTCCKHLYLDWGGCHSDPYVLANCIEWQGHFAPCSECELCCKFDGYCTSWLAAACLEYEGTPVDCAECWGP